MSPSKIEKTIIARQTEFLKHKDVDEKGYLAHPQDNLIEPFPHWEQIKKEFNEGKGSELKRSGGKPPKFLSVRSSSALCVNNFAPFKAHGSKLSFSDYSGFDETRFEKEQPTGLDGTQPHLDFYLENKTTIIGIESKFTEYFVPKRPNHPTKHQDPTKSRKNNLEKYCNKKELNYLPKGFQESIIEHYFADNEPQHLDVAQLIKHTIGLLNNRREKKVVLVYLYWEPLNPTVDNLFVEHRRDIEKFKSLMERFIKFVPWSYPEFWKLYENEDLLKEHIRKVRDRYEFEIKS